MAHHRQYLPGSRRTSHYDLIVWRQHAQKLANWQTKQQVTLLGLVVSGRKGTTSYEQATAAMLQWASQMPLWARVSLRVRVWWRRVRKHGLWAA